MSLTQQHIQQEQAANILTQLPNISHCLQDKQNPQQKSAICQVP
jgi:hypothetical protein